MSRTGPPFNAKAFQKCTCSERGGSHLAWTASLYIFSVSGLLNFSPTAHHNGAILHSPKQPLCSALLSKMSIQKEGICLVKVKYSNDGKNYVLDMVLCNNLHELGLYFIKKKKENKSMTHLSCETSTYFNVLH